MKQSEEYIISVVVLALVCACVTGYPATQNSPRQINDILDELRQELAINQKQARFPSYPFPETPLTSLNAPNIPSSFGTFGYLQQKSAPSDLTNNDGNTNQVNLGVEKRQGSWDYDYGLGGGRFGKRGAMFADYSLGGGRFGRDVDHVLQENADFDEDLDGQN